VSDALAPLHLPPSPDAPAAAPPAVPRDGAARRTLPGRLRRFFLRGWVTACAVIVIAMLLPPLRREPSIVIALFAGALGLAPCGVGLGCVALVERTRESALALLVAALAFAATVSLLPVAFRVNTELWFAAHQVELDALAAEIRSAFAHAGPAAAADGDALVAKPFRDRLWRMGIASVRRTDGGLLFDTWPGGEVLLYADGVPDDEPGCHAPRLRALGGRWYQWWCGPQRGWLD